MKAMKKLLGLALAAGLTLTAAGCAGNMPNSDVLAAEGFGLLGDGNDGEMAPGGGHRGHHGGKGGFGLFGGPMMGMMMKDLNLSDAQKAEFKALFEAAKAKHQQGARPDMKAMHAKLKTAFLSDSFDANALRSELQAKAPDPAAMTGQMAENIVKAWKILTPEQQTKVLAGLDKMEQRMEGFRQKHTQAANGDHPGAQHLKMLAEKLQLTADQQSKLQELWQSGKPNREEHLQAMRAVKQQVVAELKGGNPSAERISALIAPMAAKGRQGMGGHLDKMAAVHAVLTPAQRAQLVILMEQKMSQHGRGHGRGR